MATGRRPGDFWPRCPGYVPPGAASSSDGPGDESELEPENEGELCAEEAAVNFLEGFIARGTLESDDDGDGAATMKRPGARFKRPAAAKAKASAAASSSGSVVPKAKAKGRGRGRGRGCIRSSPKAKAKGTAKAKAAPASRAAAGADGGGDGDEVMSPDGHAAGDADRGGGPALAPPATMPTKPGCSKCRYSQKGCAKCR